MGKVDIYTMGKDDCFISNITYSSSSIILTCLTHATKIIIIITIISKNII